MPGKSADREPVEKDVMNSVEGALDARMADFDIPASMAAFLPQRIRIVSVRSIGHEIVYHI